MSLAVSFHEVRLPEKYARGALGGPVFRTRVIRKRGGHEQRNIAWSSPLGRWNIGHLIKTPADLAALTAFHRARWGRAYGFRFKDWTDYTSASDGVSEPAFTDQRLGTGDGATTSFQLVKLYSDGAYGFTRTVAKPVAGTLRVGLGGLEQTSGWSLDATTGLVTFATAPPAGQAVTAGYAFDVPVRFDVDEQAVSWDTVNTRSWPNIILVELRL